MTEPHGHEPGHTRDTEFAPVLREEDEPTEGDAARSEGRQVTGTGVPTGLPRDGADDEAHSVDEGPAIGASAHEDEPRAE